MKKYSLGLALIGLSAMLTGCSSQADCTSSDVQETYLGMVGNLNDEDAMEILKSSVFKSVVTQDVDKGTGYRSCAAKIVMEGEAGARERSISYEIEQVESGDASFKVYADRNDLGQVSYMATALARENRTNKKTKEMIDAAAADPYVLATEQDAREASIAVGNRFFGDRVDESSVRAAPLDIDGDGVMEFLTAMRISYASGDSTWYAFASHQYPKGPGEKNAVEFAGEGAIEALGEEPSNYEMQGKSLVITMADGSKKSLAYHASTEAYRSYIQANGGNPSASITPSAMSVAAAPGTPPMAAPASDASPVTPAVGTAEDTVAPAQAGQVEQRERQPKLDDTVMTTDAAESDKGQQGISPSFDCNQAASRVEKLICGNPQLAQADTNLAKAYKQANACTTDKVRLRTAQRTWMTARNACTDKTCIADEYMRRSADLAAECAS